MIFDLDKTRQRQLAIGLLVVTVVLVLSVTVVPVFRLHTSYVNEIERLTLRLQSLRAGTEADEALGPRLEQLRAAQATVGHHLKSETATVAAAELQRIISGLGTDNGVQLLSTQILPAVEGEDFTQISLRARMRGTFQSITHTLHEIEVNPTFLFLDNVSIRDGARRRLQRSKIDNQFETEIDVSAYMPGTGK